MGIGQDGRALFVIDDTFYFGESEPLDRLIVVIQVGRLKPTVEAVTFNQQLGNFFQGKLLQ
jgi:hypothetical protein